MSAAPHDFFSRRADELDGHTVVYLSDIKSGKEAVVYKVLFDGELAAMKVYKDPEHRTFTHVGAYLAGKYYKHASERKAVAKNNRFGRKLKHSNWVKREFFLLQSLFKVGARIPKPIALLDTAIVMQLLGDQDTVAQRLSDVELSDTDARAAYEKILATIQLFWEQGIVHGDLSAYNVLWWHAEPYIIDFPQAIDIRRHPEPEQLLERDRNNIARYFSKYEN